MKYTIYNVASGDITKVVECQEDVLLLQVSDGESAILGDYNDTTQIVINGLVVNKPPPPYDLTQTQLIKVTEINKACETAILSGFTSIALGTPHHYPSNDRDQVNLSGTIQRSLLSANIENSYLLLCADSTNIWEYRNHTTAQIQQVGADAYDAVLGARVKKATLQAKIFAAKTQDELDSLIW